MVVRVEGAFALDMQTAIVERCTEMCDCIGRQALGHGRDDHTAIAFADDHRGRSRSAIGQMVWPAGVALRVHRVAAV